MSTPLSAWCIIQDTELGEYILSFQCVPYHAQAAATSMIPHDAVPPPVLEAAVARGSAMCVRQDMSG